MDAYSDDAWVYNFEECSGYHIKERMKPSTTHKVYHGKEEACGGTRPDACIYRGTW